MGTFSNFKIPKIDTKLLKPDTDLLGINTSEINSKVTDIASKIDTGKIDLGKLGNAKDTALNMLKSVPKIGNFSLMSLVPSGFLDKLDTNNVTKSLNADLAGLDLGVGSLKLPDNIGSMAKDLISGKGIDFSSLYTMPSIYSQSEYSLGSDFSLDEMMAEVNSMSDIATGDFDVNEYLKEYSDIQI